MFQLRPKIIVQNIARLGKVRFGHEHVKHEVSKNK
jgi:hypothetical protein